jgi:phage I-like protein
MILSEAIDLPLQFVNGKPPDEFMIFPAGKWTAHKDGKLKVRYSTPENMQAIVALSRKRRKKGTQMMCDFYHNSLSGSADPLAGIAAAWYDLEVRNGAELWAINVDWKDRALDFMAADEIRHFSPAFAYDENGNVTDFINLALTNIPAMDENKPLMAASIRASIERSLQKFLRRGTSRLSALHERDDTMADQKPQKLSEYMSEHEMSLDEMEKGSGVKKDRLKAIMGGEKCSDDELDGLAKCFGKEKDEIVGMHKAQHAEADDGAEGGEGSDDEDSPDDQDGDDGDGDDDDEPKQKKKPEADANDDASAANPNDDDGGEGEPEKKEGKKGNDEFAAFTRRAKSTKVADLRELADDLVEKFQSFTVELLSATGAKSRSEALGMIRGWKGKAAMTDKLSARLEKLEAKSLESELDGLIAQGMRSGQISKEMEKWARQLGRKDIDQLSGFLKSAPKRFASTSRAVPNQEPGGGAETLSQTGKSVAEQLGISEEDFAKKSQKSLDRLSRLGHGSTVNESSSTVG